MSNHNCEGVKFLDPAETARKYVDLLRQQEKCDVVICISHLGWNSNRGDDDQYMIQGSRDIDLVLGGHTHTYMPTLEYEKNLDGKLIPVDQNGKHAIVVGKMVIDLK